MTYRTLRRITEVILLFLFLSTDTLFSRDINLDEIYINTSSTLYTRLIQKKERSYSLLDATKIDQGVIFAGWVSPSSIVYIKEFKSINRNIVYQYNLQDPKKHKIIDITGALIYTKLSKNGNYLICKSLTYNGDQTFDNKIIIIDLLKNTVHTKRSHTVFTDFTVSVHGDTVYYERNRGIIAYDPKTRKETLFLPKNKYRPHVSSANTTLCYVSPEKNKTLLLSGGGGNYTGTLLVNDSYRSSIKGITSSREIFWLDNSSIVFRSGYIGNYSVKTYHTRTRKYKTLLRRSLNTNITDSTHSQHITYLKDGIIHYYNIQESSHHSLLLEGEDALMSPLGDYVSSLYNKSLYITRLHKFRSSKVQLRRNASSILAIYDAIQGNKTIQENEYSSEYIKRKHSIYKSITP